MGPCLPRQQLAPLAGFRCCMLMARAPSYVPAAGMPPKVCQKQQLPKGVCAGLNECAGCGAVAMPSVQQPPLSLSLSLSLSFSLSLSLSLSPSLSLTHLFFYALSGLTCGTTLVPLARTTAIALQHQLTAAMLLDQIATTSPSCFTPCFYQADPQPRDDSGPHVRYNSCHFSASVECCHAAPTATNPSHVFSAMLRPEQTCGTILAPMAPTAASVGCCHHSMMLLLLTVTTSPLCFTPLLLSGLTLVTILGPTAVTAPKVVTAATVDTATSLRIAAPHAPPAAKAGL